MKTTGKVVLGGLAAGALVAGAAAGVGAVIAGRRLLRYARRNTETLRGQTVVITGGSRGLGLALAEEFARHGCRIVICARDADELGRAQKQIEALGAEVATLPCDISKQEEAEMAKKLGVPVGPDAIYQRLGTGGVDFPAVIAVLREHQYDGWISLDFNAADMAPGVTIDQDMAAHRKYLVDTLHATMRT